MRSARVAALAFALALALLAGDKWGASCAGVAGADEPDDEEGDTAPFMVAVRHADGRACGAALVSLRTALSSAACARGAGELWAVAGGASASARRVVRVAAAAGEEPGAPVAGDPWSGAHADLALLELAAPLPSARSILMATDPADCAPPQHCHLVRLARSPRKGSKSRSEGGPARLRIVDAALEAGGTCAARGPGWAALRARTLCLSGPELCQGDRGAGVVCGGKLCGVVSRSAPGPLCGDAHAAASVPRWRRFLHCAHTRGACGRDGDCARLCSERWLVDAPPEASPAPPTADALQLGTVVTDALQLGTAVTDALQLGTAVTDALQLGTAVTDALQLGAAVTDSPARTDRVSFASREDASQGADIQSEAGSPRTEPARDSSPAGPAGSEGPAGPAGLSPRGAFEFEPNRADFKMSAATARVFLKAGEYGDNGAEYLAPDDSASVPGPVSSAPVPGPGAPAPLSRTPAPAPGTAPAPARDDERAARADRAPRERLVAADRASTASPLSTLIYLLLFIIYII